MHLILCPFVSCSCLILFMSCDLVKNTLLLAFRLIPGRIGSVSTLQNTSIYIHVNQILIEVSVSQTKQNRPCTIQMINCLEIRTKQVNYYNMLILYFFPKILWSSLLHINFYKVILLGSVFGEFYIIHRIETILNFYWWAAPRFP